MLQLKLQIRGLEIFPDNIRLKLLRSEALYRLGNDDAIVEYLDILSLLERDASIEETYGITESGIKGAIGQAYRRKANESYLDNRPEDAISSYYKAIEFIPDSINLYNNLAYVLYENGNPDEALNILQSALEKYPDAENLNVLKGQILSDRGDMNELVEVYADLYREYPDNLNYGIIYGQLLMSTNQATSANRLFEALISENPEEKRLYETLIKLNEQRYDYGGKRNVLKMQKAAFPNDREVAESLAETHVLIEEYNEARAIYDSLAVVADNSGKYRHLSAKTWVFEEDFITAIDEYEAILSYTEAKPELLLESAAIYLELDQPLKAVDKLQKADSLLSQDKTKVQIAHILMDLEQHEEAAIYFNNLAQTEYESFSKYYLSKFPTDEEFLQISADNYGSILSELLSVYSKLFENFTERASERSNNLSQMTPKIFLDDPVLEILEKTIDDFFAFASNKFDYDQNLKIIDQALITHPESPKLHYQKGELAFKNEELTPALNSFRKAVEYGASDYNLFFLMGKLHKLRGDTDKAILAFEQTLTMNPDFRDAYSQLINVSQENGQLGELCNRWMMKYKAGQKNVIFRESLIEALHKADRFEEANQILRSEESR